MQKCFLTGLLNSGQNVTYTAVNLGAISNILQDILANQNTLKNMLTQYKVTT